MAKKWSSYVDDEASTTSWAADAWYDEVNDPGYDFNDPGYYENPGAGHFTAMVWRTSCELGCAVASGWDSNGQWYEQVVVCRYSPPGNWLG